MTNFNSKEIESIIKIGSGNYDIRAKRKYYDTNVYDHIAKIEDNSTIKAFLDHQFNENEFQFSIVAMLFSKSNSNWMPDNDKRKIILEWIESVVPVKPTIVRILFDEFLSQRETEFDEEAILNALKNKEDKEIISILDFALILTNESISLHRKFCTELGCNSEVNFDQRTSFIQGKKKIIKGQNIKIDLNKIEWLGTQKQLAELFVELKNNAWIEDFNKETLKACFTKSNTIQQVLKPNTDTSTGNDDYDGIYTTNYDPMFHGIIKNKKPAK